ncbi:KUP/HAK/KT family potassium transporter, partial [Escherichia coli]|uniref:KUP/HAK/KT family potassium transporter n=1 Tax=Escherichia coli TaxID=562 RepID=UPI003754CD85
MKKFDGKERKNDLCLSSGDGALTPAISVLSAVEGLTTTSTSLTKWVLPITIIIIIALFVVQMFGTTKI